MNVIRLLVVYTGFLEHPHQIHQLIRTHALIGYIFVRPFLERSTYIYKDTTPIPKPKFKISITLDYRELCTQICKATILYKICIYFVTS